MYFCVYEFNLSLMIDIVDVLCDAITRETLNTRNGFSVPLLCRLLVAEMKQTDTAVCQRVITAQ